MNLHQLTTQEAHKGLKNKEFTSIELTQSCLERIKELDPKIHAFLTVTEEVALAQAEEADRRIISGEKIDILTGIPVAIKDIIVTKDIRTTAASKILDNYTPPYDATCIKKLKKQGAVILGKTNLDEFAHGASTERSAFGPTRNPWDLERVPGGSSGGSAAAVSADMCIASLGTDTGGSIRYPATFCGVVGLKPSYGRASRYGLIAMTSSTDVPGPITKNVEDAAIILEAIAGGDEKDATTSLQDVPNYSQEIKKDVKDIKIGIPKEFFIEGIDPEVEDAVMRAIEHLEHLGVKTKEVSLPHTKYGIPVYYVITPSEISANLSRFDGIRYGYSESEAKNLYEVFSKSRGKGFGPEAKRRIMIGAYALSSGYYDAYYLQAQKVRTVMRKEIEEVFKSVDLLVTPTAPHTAFKIGEKIDDPLKMYLEDIFMSTASLCGLPAISIPCGFSKAGLPIGMQIIGPQFEESRVLQLAYHYEQTTDWHNRRPSL